jgi:hypothetical protein
MRRKSRAFRASSAVLAVLVAHFLCGGTQWAAAAGADGRAAARRAAQAATLGVPVALLENPAGRARRGPAPALDGVAQLAHVARPEIDGSSVSPVG